MKIGIVGLGLIGGSLGLKLQSLNHTIYGIANNEFNEQKAKDKKLANFVSCDLSLLKKCELIILALPIKDLISPSQQLVSSIPKGAILTDVGSVKEPIVNKWENLHPLFIGSHPMAGTEKKGVDSGFESLFKNDKLASCQDDLSSLCELVIVTLGSNGSLIINKNDIEVIMSVNKGKVIDTTGAGDIYAGGFIHGLINNYSLKKCGEIASICAGQIITQLGSRSDNDLKELIK